MNLGELLAQGGWAMWPIYLCSLVAFIVFIQRAIHFRAIGLLPKHWLEEFLNNVRGQKMKEALAQCERSSHPIARVLYATIVVYHQRPERAEAEAERNGEQQLQKVERYLPLLAFITQIAPLLGLLGTVLGMVKMFFGLQQSGMANVDVSVLSSGIWQALLTTAAGLIVAAPTLAGYSFLVSRVERFRAQLRDAVTQLLTALPSLTTSQPPSLFIRSDISGQEKRISSGYDEQFAPVTRSLRSPSSEHFFAASDSEKPSPFSEGM